MTNEQVDAINALAEEVRAINLANGWNITMPEDWAATPYKVPTMLALIMSEGAEALEAFRADDREEFAAELADIVIRVLDAAPGLEVDIGRAIQQKLEKNRFRGFRHGGKRV